MNGIILFEEKKVRRIGSQMNERAEKPQFADESQNAVIVGHGLFLASILAKTSQGGETHER